MASTFVNTCPEGSPAHEELKKLLVAWASGEVPCCPEALREHIRNLCRGQAQGSHEDSTAV